MAERRKRRLGRVVPRESGREGWRIDFGRRLRGRFLGSLRGKAFHSRELAESVLEQVEDEVARGRSLEDVVAELSARPRAQIIGPLLDRWVKLFRQRVRVGERAPRTLRELERWNTEETGHFRWWEEKSLADISRASVEEWSLWLATDRNLSPKSRRNVLAGFHSFLSWVAEDVQPGWEPPRFTWPELDERQPTVLSQELQRKVLNAIPEPRRGIFLAMAACLIRPSEARALRKRDWTVQGNELRVSRAAKDRATRGVVRGLKSRNVKTVPIVDNDLTAWLLQRVGTEAILADPDGPLFENPAGHEEGWWSETAMRRVWANACKRVGVTGVGLYEGTKHSTATRLKALGADDRVLQSLMGHRDVRSVRFYAGLSGATLRSALVELDRKGKAKRSDEGE